MATKLFSGLGSIKDPFAVDGAKSLNTILNSITSQINSTVKTAVDHAAGVPHPEDLINTVLALSNETSQKLAKAFPPPQKVGSAPPLPPTPLPTPLTTVGKISARRAPSPVTFVSNFEPQTFSHESSLAPYETLYNDFLLNAEPVYNFWVDDEETNDQEEKGERKLDELPRYMRINWQIAPNLSSNNLIPKDVNFRTINPVKFGLQSENEMGFSSNGSTFVPEHLRPDGFSLIRNSLANGFIYPGVIDSIVELSMDHVSPNSDVILPKDQSFVIDEDAFLTSHETEGLSVHELLSNGHEYVNGMLDQGWQNESPISNETQTLKNELFQGNFSFDRSLAGHGSFNLRGVQSSSPLFSLFSKTAKSTQKGFFDGVKDLLEKVTQPPSISSIPEMLTNSVKFINSSIDGILSTFKTNLMSEPHHVEAMMAVAQALPNLDVLSQSGFHEEIKKIDAPSFPSPPGLKKLEYVGYVLEKYRMKGCNGFELVEQIELPNREFDEYIDTKILYGVTYRYRIKAILRWTRPSSEDLNPKDPFTITQFASQTAPVAPFKSTYFGTQWGNNWAYASAWDTQPPPPPDELTVRPESLRNRISISIKFPENSQRDIFFMKILRKIQDFAGNDLTDWAQVGPDFGPQNAQFYDTDVDFFQNNSYRYVYTAQTVSRHWEWSTYSEQIGARLNKDSKVFGEYPVDFVSCAGVNPSYFGAFSVSPPKRMRSEVVVPLETTDRSEKTGIFSLSGRDSNGNGSYDEVMYFMKIESLDTGEKKSFCVCTEYKNLPEKINELPIDPFMVSQNLLSNVGQDRKSKEPSRFVMGPSAGPGGQIVPTDRVV